MQTAIQVRRPPESRFQSGVKLGVFNILASLQPLIICGPSGVGKGTLLKMLQEEFGDGVGLCISHTTRVARPGEDHGVHYYFVSESEMKEGIASGKFLEYASVHGNLYGTARSSLQEVQNRGCLCMIDVDVQGARSLRAAGVEGTYVFVSPPSKEVLEERLRGRGTESEEVVKKRLSAAQREIDASAEAGLFDHVLCNDDVKAAYARLKTHLSPSLKALAARRSPTTMSLGATATLSKPDEAKGKLTPIVIFVLGGPGSGKGTQCGLITEHFNIVHLSAGDLLRAEQSDASSPYSMLINSCIKDGKIVPVEITCKLINNAMEKNMETCSTEEKEGCRSVFLIDGFPRNMDNLNGWKKEVGHDARCVLFLECSEEKLEERLLERGKTSGRADDNIQSIKKRFNTFQSETLPVVDKFRAAGKLRVINAEQDVPTVFANVQKILMQDVPEVQNLKVS